MLLKCCTQYVSKFGKLSSGHRTRRGQFSFQSQKRAMPKNVQTTVQPHSFHMLARLHSKSFKLDFCSMWTKNIQMIQAGFQRGTRGQIVSIHWLVEKARQFQKKKNLCLLHWLLESFWLFGSQQNCGEFLRWEYQTTLPASWEGCMWVKK